MNFILFELAQDLQAALVGVEGWVCAHDGSDYQPGENAALDAVRAAIAKAEAAGVTARTLATPTEGD
jgi:hypothetical protein